LHDERFYTGGCHHALECTNFKGGCNHCPQSRAIFEPLVIRQQRKLSESFRKAKSLTVIAPSDWIASRARTSKILEFADVIKINNPLESEFLNNSALVKKDKKISSPFIVSFVAQDLFNPYKGLETLLECIKIYENEFTEQQIQFMFVGKGPNIDIKALKFRQIEKLFSSQMTDIYFETDLLIVPSLVDNSPNVIFEALACGTPFVGSNQAGIPEISEIFGMETFMYGDPHSMFRAIIKQKESKVDPDWVRNTALELVHPDKVAARVLKLYKSKLTEEV
jgi:glycosyltransferase involved in cell wall biosynthesis